MDSIMTPSLAARNSLFSSEASNEIKSATAMAERFANNDRKGIQICRGVL